MITNQEMPIFAVEFLRELLDDAGFSYSQIANTLGDVDRHVARKMCLGDRKMSPEMFSRICGLIERKPGEVMFQAMRREYSGFETSGLGKLFEQLFRIVVEAQVEKSK